MNAIDTFPPAAPLRDSLPRMREETAARLSRWACGQPGSMAWLLRRKYDYMDAMPLLQSAADHRAVEATVALELLRWRTAYATDREAVNHLNLPLAITQKDSK